MRYRTPVITLAATLALALLLGVLLPSDSAVYAAPPVFDTTPDPSMRSVAENTPPGVNIGDPISATDEDEDEDEFGDTLTYSLEGTDAASFDIDPSTGQLITKAPLDYENPHGGSGNNGNDYSVTVKVDDGENPQTQRVTIRVTDVDEPPAAPYSPTVVSGEDENPSDDPEESTTSLKVVWHPPENTGPSISGYDVQYKKSTDTSFSDWTHGGTDTTITINQDGLEPGMSYQVRVRAKSSESQDSQGEEIAPWSLVGTGSTNKEGNSPPQSNDESPAPRNVAENTPAGENVDSSVTATDQDTTTLTYRLDGPDADLFNFDTRSGQIRTKAPLNHEDPQCGYPGTGSPNLMHLSGDGDCGRWGGRKRRDGHKCPSRGQDRAPVRAEPPCCSGDGEIEHEPRGELERAREHGARHYQL